jgi:3-deoxy-D-manno-octulosonic-acid transferase
MGLFMRLADIVVMGGSFAPGIGGHNPLEPARLERAIVSGPDTYNFANVYADMTAAGAVRIASGEALGTELTGLLSAPAQRKALGVAAATYAAGQRQAFDAGWALIRGLLP